MGKVFLRYRHILAGLLLLIVSAYHLNSSLFYHNHIVDGRSVFHSHISSHSHRSTPFSDGGHSYDALKLISLLNNIQYEDQQIVTPHIEIERQVEYTLVAQSESCKSFTLKHLPYLRAPPVDLYC